MLPVKAKLGSGKSKLNLKTDMSIGTVKANSAKGKLGGQIYKNPGGKKDGANPKITAGARKRM